MAQRKRPRGSRRQSAVPGSRSRQLQEAKQAEALAEETEKMAGYVTFAQASAITGIDKYRVGEVVKRAGVPVYRSPADARKKFLKQEDVARLTAPRPETPEDAGSAE